MKVSDYILKYFADKGISHCFLVYGSAIGHLVDSFYRIKDIEYICTQHEQGAGFAAEGWARVTGLPGMAMATSGPGGTNLLTSIANCWYDSVPTIFIVGNIKTQYMKKSDELRQIGFQENNICAMASPVCKYVHQLSKNIDEIPSILEKLWIEATTGRPGPVLLDIPMDVAAMELNEIKIRSDTTTLLKEQDIFEDPTNSIDSYLNDLQKSSYPTILVGGGCYKYRKELRNLTDKLKIPIFPTWNALDIATSDYEYYGGRVGTYGGAGRNYGIQNSDLLLILGSRVSGRITGGDPKSFAPKAKTYVVDVDQGLLKSENQQRVFDVNIHCNVGQFIKKLENRLISTDWFKNQSTDNWDSWVDQCIYWRDKYDPVLGKHYDSCRDGFVHPYVFCKILSEEASDNAVIVGDTGGGVVCIAHAFKTKWGQRYFANNGNSPMGFSLCGALGAAIGSSTNRNINKRIYLNQIICIIGDGGMQVNIQELQTLKYYNIPVKVFILNNDCYGITRQYERTNFEGRELACGPDGYSVPDFYKIGMAYGIESVVCDGNGFENSIDSIRHCIKNVLKSEDPVVCNVMCKDFDHYEPRVVGWSTPIDKMEPQINV